MDEMLNFNEDDPRAGRAVYKLLAPQLILFANQFTSDKRVAEEIVNDSFVKVLTKRNVRFYDLTELKAYLYYITKNACIDYQRQVERDNKHKIRYNYLAQQTDEVEDTVELEKVKAEFLAYVIQLIGEQPEKRRQALEGLYIEGKDAKEIAAIMNIHVSGVYKKRDEFLKYLREDKGIDAKFLVMLLGS